MHLPESEKSAERASSKRRSIVDRIVSGSAMFVALASLAIAFYEVRMMRQHDRISVWPYVSAFNSDSGGIYTFNTRNAGIGPALIRSFEVLVDDKPRKNWGEVLDALAIELHGTPSTYTSFGSGTVLLPGATSTLLSIGPGEAGQAFHRAVQDRMRVRICYCSLYEQCWQLDEKKAPEPQPVRSCREPATPFAQ